MLTPPVWLRLHPRPPNPHPPPSLLLLAVRSARVLPVPIAAAESLSPLQIQRPPPRAPLLPPARGLLAVAVAHRARLPRPHAAVQGVSPDRGHDAGRVRVGRAPGDGVHRLYAQGEAGGARAGGEGEGGMDGR